MFSKTRGQFIHDFDFARSQRSKNANVCVTTVTFIICDSGTATCEFHGDPHFKTFDGDRYEYQGICKYLVARPKMQSTTLPYFEVYARAERRYRQTSVAYVYYAEIVYRNETIRLQRGGTVNRPSVGYINVTVSSHHWHIRNLVTQLG